MMTETMIKVRFELDVPDWHGHGSETLWAAPVANSEWHHFEIRNSPFFATGINHLDVVTARPTENDTIFDFIAVAKRGGHSTYMILMQPGDTRTAAYWNMLEKMGCSYESTHIGLSIGRRLLYSVDVPPTADGYEVYDMLERGHDDGVWIFQTGDSNIVRSTPSDE
jgi:Domain of unknown function (DUF4265)